MEVSFSVMAEKPTRLQACNPALTFSSLRPVTVAPSCLGAVFG